MKIKNLIFSLSILTFFIPHLVSGQLAAFIDLKKPTGKVKSYVEHAYEIGSGQPVLIEKTRHTYNEKDQLIQKTIYNTIDSNAIDYNVDFTYEDDLLSEETSENRFKITYLYNELGKKIARKYKSDEEQYLERYIYDEMNKLIVKHKYNEEGNLKFSELYSYDKKGRLIGRQYVDIDSTSNSSTVSYSLDTENAIVQERIYASNEHIVYSRAFEYDDHKNKIEERRYSASGNLQNRSQYKYRYDAKGNWTSIQYLSKSASYLITRSFNY